MKPNINTKEFSIKKENFYKTKFKKKQIILAGSLRANSNYIKHLYIKEYGKTKKWCTYTISRDGKIFQHYDPAYYTDFMGIKTIDKHSISIVLENMGSIFYDYDSEKWLNWAMEVCDESLVYEKSWKGTSYWESYTEEQFKSVVELSKYLCETYDINVDCIGYNVYKNGTADFEGIVTRSNFDIDYDDLNPSFNFKKYLIDMDIDIIDHE